MREHWFVIAILAVALCGGGTLGCLSSTAYAADAEPTPSAAPEVKADPAMQLQEAMRLETGGGDVAPALEIYKQIVRDSEKVRPIAAKAGLHIGIILERQGKKDDAVAAYKALVDGYADMPEANDARVRLQALGAAETTEEKDQKALQDKLDKRLDKVDLADATLQQVVDYLRTTGGVNVVLEARAQEVNRKTSLSLADVTVRELTNLAVQSFNLDWTIWSGAVYISEPMDVNNVRGKQQQNELAFSLQIANLQAENAGLRKQLQELNASSAKPAEMKRELGRTGASERPDADQLRTKREETIRTRSAMTQLEDAKRKRAEVAQEAMQKRRMRYTPPAATEAPKPEGPQIFEATLYLATLKEFVGPQAIDLDTRKVLAIAPAGDCLEFFQKHPEFDLAFVAGNVFIANKGTRAAIAPEDINPEDLPQPIQYPNPRSAKDVVANTISGTMKYEPGVYTDESRSPTVYTDESGGYTVIVPHYPGAAFVLKTDKSEYFVRIIDQGGDNVRIAYRTLQPAPPNLSAGAYAITSSDGSLRVVVPAEPQKPEAPEEP